MTTPIQDAAPSNFIREIIVEDLKTNKYGGRVHTRFPPEPNGYLHVGHAKSIHLNFGLAKEFGGKCNLRFDDTNPSKEETEYVESIIEDVRWLGGDWEGRLFYASDYFDQLHAWAVRLIEAGKAYVCDLSAEEVRRTRGTLTEPGEDSPYRNRSIEENLQLFEGMRAGEFPDGSRTLRAKIDMASPNLNLRDPVMYRVLRATHHRTGDKWCIYPMYDFAHGESDSIEKITHSICTLEFEDHRPLYDWYVEQLGIYHPQQIEFDRLNLTYTLLSKRKLLALVEQGRVRGWDDPRMPTISGMRRRGYTPEAIGSFCRRIGVSKTNGTTELGLLEYFVRDDLNKRTARVMGVLRPLRVVIDNYPEGQTEMLEAINNPEDAGAGTRQVPFSRVLYIEQDDFREDPPKQYFRLTPGREVRLRYGYFITCTGVAKNDRVGRNDEDFEPVNLVELRRFRFRRTGHARQLFIHAEIILEGDGGERLILALDLHILLGFDRLVQTVGPAASRHQAPGEFVHDDHFAVFDHIFHVSLIKRMRFDGGLHVMLQRPVWGRRCCQSPAVFQLFPSPRR